ncbi:MAG: immunoglobulin domain-containing protein [Chitinivibrionales bacterium]|nr:immunoglobulin domain-containing protein [Chitinivibrionales bacterium]
MEKKWCLTSVTAVLGTISCLIYLFCVDPELPPEGPEFVSVKITVAEKTETPFKGWKKDEAIPINVVVRSPKYAESVVVNFGEGSDSKTIPLATSKYSDTTLRITDFFYPTIGVKIVSAVAFIRGSGQKKAAQPCTLDIGIEPKLVDPQKKLKESGLQVFDMPFFIEAEINDAPKVTFIWYKNRDILTDKKSQRLEFPRLTILDQAKYRLIATNLWGADTSAEYLIDASSVKKAPKIIEEPAPMTVTAGKPVRFSIRADGDELKYQWQKNQVDVSGAVTETYDIPSAVLADSGKYRCVVSNSVGRVTSAEAQLQVVTTDIAPVITEQPINITVAKGDSALFKITVSGTNLLYQWFQNDQAISGAKERIYKIVSAQMTDNGALFFCKVENSVGNVVSTKATLTVKEGEKPKITQQPQDASVSENAKAIFVVTASGSTLSYQWFKNGSILTGATTATYETPAVIMADNGSLYRCIVSNETGADTSRNATLTVQQGPVKPQITTQPVDVTTLVGGKAVFTITAQGTDVKYQWQKNEQDIAGATANTYEITAVSKSDNGVKFRCKAYNIVGEVLSNFATLMVQDNTEPIKITQQPVNSKVKLGESAIFSVTATGTSPQYQWKKNGNDIAGAIANSYTTPATQKTDHNSKFICVVKNSANEVASLEVVLTVIWPPKVTRSPSNQTVKENANVSFSVEIENGNPETVEYVWKDKNESIVGGNTKELSLTATRTMDGQSYGCIVKNEAGEDKSTKAKLTVQWAPKITSGPTPNSFTAKPGETVNFSVEVEDGNPKNTTFIWKDKNNTAVGNSKTLSFSARKEDDKQSYTCVVKNDIGESNPSSAAKLTVQWAPEFAVGPQNGEVEEGKSINFSVNMRDEGNPVCTYQWYVGSSQQSGSSQTCSYTAKRADDSRDVYCIARNSVDNVTSPKAVVRVWYLDKPVISISPSNAQQGSKVIFDVTVSGNPNNYTYQWSNGRSEKSFSIEQVSKSNEGRYTCKVSNGKLEKTSDDVQLNIIVKKPTILKDPVPCEVWDGENVSFEVVVNDEGNGPFKYQWYKGPLPYTGTGANTSRISFAATKNDAYSYYCEVSNDGGTSKSVSAQLLIYYFSGIRDNTENGTLKLKASEKKPIELYPEGVFPTKGLYYNWTYTTPSGTFPFIDGQGYNVSRIMVSEDQNVTNSIVMFCAISRELNGTLLKELGPYRVEVVP